MTPGLIFISGSSGAGKSSALRLLEDEGYYCVDNLPPRLLPQFSEEVLKHTEYDRFRGVAVCIDARTIGAEESAHTEALERILSTPGRLILFLDAQPHALLKRFSETRRRHPLAGPDNSLPEAIARERRRLEFIAARADLLIDTTDLTPRALRDAIVTRIIDRPEGLSVLLESFAFKRGVPTDSDFVFDARALPNPYWQTELRGMTGLDAPVIQFLNNDSRTVRFFGRLNEFVMGALTDFSQSDRSYMTIAIGCTGGQHRSVYLTQKLHASLTKQFTGIQIRHRDLPASESK
ncbi:MAG: RNase adapter RapZ [Halieaceae bacterium]